VYSKNSSSYVLLQQNCIDDDGNIWWMTNWFEPNEEVIKSENLVARW
jgi:hypothetical protein